jgi:hypothetical protein
MAWKLSRSRVNHPLRYFVYVSDAKLETLFDQIPPQLRRRLSAQAKVDLKLASLSIKAAEQPAPTRMAKLKVVERYIDRHQRVGTVQGPGSEYFRGTMPMRWGWLRDPAAPYTSPHHGFNVAFFRGERDDHTVVLVGSRRHVLGESPAPPEVDPISQAPTIERVIAKHVSDLQGFLDREAEKRRETPRSG